MDGIITGVGVGVVLIAVNAIISRVKNKKKTDKAESQQLAKNESRIGSLEREQAEIKEIAKITLCTCVIIGDGMVQHGINGDFKKAFSEKKQDALKML
jgi:TRAP-type C4-dicarboxylate transport system permease large subunit